jgi:RHS repeat-associated protein
LTLTYDYNNLNDRVKITYPDGRDVSKAFSNNMPHLVTSRTERSGLTTQYTADPLGQRTQVLTPDGGSTTYSYDANGNLNQLTDPRGNSTTFEYNGDNKLVKKTFADGKFELFTYSAYSAGRLASHTNARNGTATYIYNGPETIGQILYSDVFTYPVMNQHDQFHRLITSSDESGDYTYGYDAHSRLTSIDGPLNGDTLTLRYDDKGRKSGYTLEGGQTVAYAYDAFDRLTSLQSAAGTFSFTYTEASTLVQRMTRPNGSYTEYQYDGMKRLTGLTNRTAADTVINQYLYTYNSKDLRASEAVTNGTPISTLQSGAVTYAYDKANRLLSSTNPARTYDYDNDGNLVKGYVPGGFAFSAAYDAENRLTSIEYEGTDMCQWFSYTFHCPHNRTYHYRSDGILAQVEREDDTTGKVVVHYIRLGALPLQERDKNNSVLREYTWQPDLAGGIGGLLSLRQGGQNYFYLYDGKGNVTAVIDSQQNVVAAYAYDDFGNLLSKTGTLDQPHQFSTKPYDERMGISYFGDRFYAPALGRWMTRNPPGEDAGANMYEFMKNDPVNRHDSKGL